jgi:hypothetical protein
MVEHKNQHRVVIVGGGFAGFRRRGVSAAPTCT